MPSTDVINGLAANFDQNQSDSMRYADELEAMDWYNPNPKLTPQNKLKAMIVLLERKESTKLSGQEITRKLSQFFLAVKQSEKGEDKLFLAKNHERIDAALNAYPCVENLNSRLLGLNEQEQRLDVITHLSQSLVFKTESLESFFQDVHTLFQEAKEHHLARLEGALLRIIKEENSLQTENAITLFKKMTPVFLNKLHSSEYIAVGEKALLDHFLVVPATSSDQSSDETNSLSSSSNSSNISMTARVSQLGLHASNKFYGNDEDNSIEMSI